MLKSEERTGFRHVHLLLLFAVACLHLFTAEQLVGVHPEASTSVRVLYKQSNRHAEDDQEQGCNP